MGTRSTINFIENEVSVIKLYNQFDGYIEGVGYDLAKFLKDYKVVNGMTGDRTNIANGIDCLALQYISKFKTKPGNMYIVGEECEESYNYTVYLDDDNKIKIKVDDIFDGYPEELLSFEEEWYNESIVSKF